METNMKQWITTVRLLFEKNRNNVILLLAVVVFLDFLSQFPYFNTILSFPYRWNTLVVVWIASVLLFSLKQDSTFFIAALIYAAIPIFVITKKTSIAEVMGNIVFFFVIFGLAQSYLCAPRRKRKTRT